MRRAALHVLSVACTATSGLVVGFCAGGLLGGPGGHDMGLGALFGGITAGFAAGMIFGLGAAWGLSPRARLRVAVGAVAIAALVAATTWIVVQRSGW